jgi:hypothetical protein
LNRPLSDKQLEAQRRFAAATLPAEIRPCYLCDGRGTLTRREQFSGGFSAVCDETCHACNGARVEVLGELPPANEMAARLEAAVEMDAMVKHPELPDWARDLIVLAAAVLRAEGE